MAALKHSKHSRAEEGRAEKRAGAGRKKVTKAKKPVNSGPKQDTRFKKGRSGNPAGKPKGTRHRTTLLAESLMQAEAEGIVNVVIAAAKNGDIPAARIILERIVPPRKDGPISFQLPTIETAGDASKAMGSILGAVAAGEITPGEAKEVSGLIEAFVKTYEFFELERRITALEAGGS